jgi:hypothetical protein
VPQNQVGYGLSIAPQNRWEYKDGAEHASGSSGLLHLKASRARFSLFCLKNGGGVITDGARGIIMEVMWK